MTTRSSNRNGKAQEAPTHAEKYLTFAIGREAYGLPALKVREIIRVTEITTIPRMPEYVRGVINLRGKIIPIVDLRLKFSLGDGSIAEQNCIVVVQVEMTPGTETAMGLIVDAVEEVANISSAEIERTPSFGAKLDTSYIQGIAKVKGSVKTLLAIDELLAAESLAIAPGAALELESKDEPGNPVCS